jgi:hypothetical protein
MSIDMTMAETERRAIFMTHYSYQRQRAMSMTSSFFSAARYPRDIEPVADRHRREDAAALTILCPADRVALALDREDRDREIFRDAAGLSGEATLRELRRHRQTGPTPTSLPTPLEPGRHRG